MKKFKVVIKKSPSMKYGGQSQYGLNTGPRNVYSQMPENPNENLNSTLQPVPRNEAVIEAEKGEVAYGDLNKNGKLVAMKIGGNPHSRGGTPLDVPEGTFIYSNTAKMKIGGPILKAFGKSENDKTKYTPADLAKQYDVNKYMSILEDPTKAHHHPTAQKMLANYQKKLAMLALVQEQKKGFPQGIPEVAKPLVNMMQQQQGGGQQPQEEQAEMTAMYGGSYRHGGMHGYPGTYDDGYSGTYSNGVYFDYGGAYMPDYSMAYGGSARPSSRRSGGGKSNDESLLIEIFNMLKQGVSPEDLYGQLIQAKIPKKKAESLLTMAVQELQTQMQQQGQQPQQEAPQEEQMMMAQQQPPMGFGGAYVPTYGDSAYGALPQYSMGADYDSYMPQAMYGMGMEYGGDYMPMYGANPYLPFADNGLEVTDDNGKRRKVKKSEIADLEKQGYKKIGDKVWRKETSRIETKDPTFVKGTPGRPGKAAVLGKGPSVGNAIRGGKAGKPWEDWIKAQLAKGVTIEELAKKGHGTVEGLKKYSSFYKPAEPAEPAVPEVAAIPDKYTCTEPGYVYNEKTGKCEKSISESDEFTYEEEQPDDDGGKGKVQKLPYKRSSPRRQMSLTVPPRFYGPDMQTFDARLPSPTFYDPRREMAKASETAAMLAAQTGQYNPRNMGAMANYLQSNVGAQQGDILGKYNNLNVGVGNQSELQRVGIMNDVLNKRSAARKQYRDELTIGKQQLDNAYRDYLNKAKKEAIMQQMVDVKSNLLNQMYPHFADYNTGALYLQPGTDAYGRITSGGPSSQGMTYEQKVAEAKRLKEVEKLDPAVINMLLNPRTTSSRQPAVNPYAYPQMMAGAQNAYPYDVSDLYD